MMKKYCITLIFFLTSCSSPREHLTPQTKRELVDLVESTTIIRTLLCQNKLGQLLEEHDPKQLNILINNFSPAAMAFESEVLSTTVPLVCVYFYQDSSQERNFIKELELLAADYDNKVKFVVIDAEKLFSLAQATEIEKLPTIAWVRNREIFEQLSEKITIASIQKKISELNPNESAL